MGEWIDIYIDDKLPKKKRASCSDTNEWWVPLIEKAYAKFYGSYAQINGGNPCWAMTDLTGGISGKYSLVGNEYQLFDSRIDKLKLLH